MGYNIREVKAYQTTDGKLFIDQDAAQNFQDTINFRTTLSNIVYNFCETETMQPLDIVNGLLNNIDSLRNMFEMEKKIK